jgi:hypothetical protein
MTAVLVSASQPDVPSPAPRRARLVAAAPARVRLDVLVRVRRVRLDRPLDDIVDEWGRQSFPASDPPANW